MQIFHELELWIRIMYLVEYVHKFGTFQIFIYLEVLFKDEFKKYI